LTIGAETVDLSGVTCSPGSNCAAYAVGDIVAATGKTAPVTNTFSADRIRSVHLLPQTVGATVEVEGKVSSVDTTTKIFVVRGINVDGSALTDPLPAVGDRVEVLGTVAADGTSVIATSIEHDEAAAAVRVTMAAPLSGVAADAAGNNTFDITLLGQTVIVDSTTHIADRTVFTAPTFNINNFKVYLDALKATPFVVVSTTVDASGNLHATGFDIVKTPANGMVAVSGPADAVDATNNVVTVHGVSVKYNTSTSPAVGSYILASGVWSNTVVDTTTGAMGSVFIDMPQPANSAPAINRGYMGF
jgi:hypothetical protein